MQEPVVQHTIDIFEHLYEFVRPILPAKITDEMQHALEQLTGDHSLNVHSVEDTMIAFGKLAWPYRKAYGEMINAYEGKIGEQFLVSHLSRPLKKRYQEFCACGGSYRDLHSGAPAQYFTAEERGELCEVLIRAQKDIRQHVTQAVHSTEQKLFSKKVHEFTDILEQLEKELEHLRHMADSEQEHPQLADEIRAHVRGIELGLCFLGPEMALEDVCHLPGHYEGRKHEIKVKARG